MAENDHASSDKAPLLAELQLLKERLGRETAAREQAERTAATLTSGYLRLLDSIQHGVIRLDASCRILYLNDFIGRYLGLDPAECIGRHYRELGFSPSTVESRERAVAEVFRTGQPLPREQEVIVDGNLPRTLKVRLVPEFDNDGRVVSVLALSRDITDSQVFEKEYRTLFNSMLEGFALHELIVDENGTPCDYRFLEVNPAFERLTGIDAQTILGRTVRDVFPDIDPEWIQRYGRVALSGVPTTFDKYFPPLGKHFQVEVFCPCPGRFAATFMDITARKSAERFLQESESRFRALFENAPLPYQSLDAYGYVLDVNRQWLTTLGYAKEDVVGRWFGDFLAPGFAEHFDRNFPMFLEACFIDGVEFTMRRKDGSYVHVVFNGRVQQDTSGAFQRTHCIFTDITAQKRNKREMLAAKEAAEQANRAKSEFLANMSHEIRTPLNGVLGMLQLLRCGTLRPDEKHYVETALTSGRNLLSILNDILSLSEIEAGVARLNAERFDPREILEDIREMFRHEADKKGLDFRLEAKTLPNVLFGDASRLRQVAFNLVANAIKFTESGSVRFGLHPLPHTFRSLTVDAVRRSPRLFDFWVEDTGVGIEPDLQSRCFEAFTQADGSYTRKYGGTGLGLRLVRRIAELMGGSLVMSSAPGEGTEIHCTMRYDVVEDSAMADVRPSSAAPPEPGLRVLLVEDEPTNRMTLGKLLQALGHEVDAVEDGVQALEALRCTCYDVVLMDIQMPVMNGLEATRGLRRMSPRTTTTPPDVPVIAITAHAMVGDREYFLDAGLDGYLSKPIDLQEMAALLDTFR
jgi:PAS domain S-box-containing protein